MSNAIWSYFSMKGNIQPHLLGVGMDNAFGQLTSLRLPSDRRYKLSVLYLSLQVEVRELSGPWGQKLPVKADGPSSGQRHRMQEGRRNLRIKDPYGYLIPNFQGWYGGPFPE